MGIALVGLLVIGGVFLLLVLWVIGLYNTLVRRRIDCDNAWSQIDVQLKRRYDLIPNLVETVKGYASHERETLDAVISARSRATQAASGSVPARAEAENMFTAAIGRLLAVAEAYPQLKADANFRQLQEELSGTENKIGFARQHFNDCVGRYEESRQSFPTNIVAGMFNFQQRDYFTVENAAERETPRVSFARP